MTFTKVFSLSITEDSEQVVKLPFGSKPVSVFAQDGLIILSVAYPVPAPTDPQPPIGMQTRMVRVVHDSTESVPSISQFAGTVLSPGPLHIFLT